MKEASQAPSSPITSGGLTDRAVEHGLNNPRSRRVAPAHPGWVAGRHLGAVPQRGAGFGQGPDGRWDLARRPHRHHERHPLRMDAGGLRRMVRRATVVPIYETSSAEQVEWILSNAGAPGVPGGRPAPEVFDQVADRVPTKVGLDVRRGRGRLAGGRGCVGDRRRAGSPPGGSRARTTSPRSSTPPARPGGPRAAF